MTNLCHLLIFSLHRLPPTPNRITGNSLICDGIISGGSEGRSTDLRTREKLTAWYIKFVPP